MEADNKKYLRLGAAVFAGLAAAILLFFFLLRIQEVKGAFAVILSALQPLFMGIVIAYLLRPIALFLERRFSKVRFVSRAARLLSVLLAIILAIGVVVLFCALVLPQLMESIGSLVRDLPGLLQAQMERLNAFLESDNDAAAVAMQIISSVEAFLAEWIKTELFSTVSMVADSILSVGFAIVNLGLAVVVAAYLLLSWERYVAQCRKLFHAISRNERVNRAVSEAVRETNRIFSGFISGKLLDSLIVGVVCYVGLLLLNVPYATLISVIVGVTNIIPDFGPFIGAVPSAFLLLLVSPEKCVVFIIFIIVLQQIDGNILGPHILGNSMGISALYITVAILLFGKLLGFMGMVIGVPLFSTIYYLVKRVAEYSLKRQGKPVDTLSYIREENEEQNSAGKGKKN